MLWNKDTGGIEEFLDVGGEQRREDRECHARSDIFRHRQGVSVSPVFVSNADCGDGKFVWPVCANFAAESLSLLTPRPGLVFASSDQRNNPEHLQEYSFRDIQLAGCRLQYLTRRGCNQEM